VTSAHAPLIALRGIAKHFGAIQALGGVELELRAGEVHALVGANGAGKSTLIKVIAGVHVPDAGTLEVRGERVEALTPRRARELGISVLHQHAALFGELSVAENLFLGRDGALVRWRRRRERAREALAAIGVELDPDRRCAELSPAQQKEVEIARALLAESPILVLDEPTAALAAREAERLLATIAGLRARGVGVLYISHRLAELERIADRITVLRDGRSVWSDAASAISRAELVRHMVGRTLEAVPRARPGSAANTAPAASPAPVARTAPVLRVRGLGCARLGLAGIDLELGAGEILGLGGLVGAGRSELAACLFGLERFETGSLELDGSPFAPRSPRAAIERGVVLVPEDRARDGLVLAATVRENAALPWLARLARHGWIERDRERAAAERVIVEMDVRATSESRAGALSGGNQQKVALGKWLAERPRVLILDEPTQGVDVAGRAEIHARVRALAASGVAVLLISSELDELLALSDRVAVLRRGRLAGTLAGAELGADAVLALALGVEERRA
jgi:ABC-type sugar transport system ATPase subunit